MQITHSVAKRNRGSWQLQTMNSIFEGKQGQTFPGSRNRQRHKEKLQNKYLQFLLSISYYASMKSRPVLYSKLLCKFFLTSWTGSKSKTHGALYSSQIKSTHTGGDKVVLEGQITLQKISLCKVIIQNIIHCRLCLNFQKYTNLLILCSYVFFGLKVFFLKQNSGLFCFFT